MNFIQTQHWFTYVETLGDHIARRVVKIPPYGDTLKYFNMGLDTTLRLNVTGVADAATALRCFTANVSYVSIIPGRMEEVGIDADTHLHYVDRRNRNGSDVIAGSMRTWDGLVRAVVANTVPTIGMRVWDSMTEENYAGFADLWKEAGNYVVPTYPANIPLIDDRNLKLTGDFFTQMDELGKPLYDDFVTKICR
jgi:transaldolase